MNARPVSVTVIGILLIATGAIGLIYHLTDFTTLHPFPYDLVWISLVRLLAIVAGIYMLHGRNWARWLGLAWIAFHVVVGALHSVFQFAVHAVLCALIAYFLLRLPAARYFRG